MRSLFAKVATAASTHGQSTAIKWESRVELVDLDMANELDDDEHITVNGEHRVFCWMRAGFALTLVIVGTWLISQSHAEVPFDRGYPAKRSTSLLAPSS